jgi:PAS domain S-box-containing protein
MYTHIDGPHGRVPVGRFKIGLIAAERQAHFTSSVIGDPRVDDQEWARREGMVAFAGYPLIVGERLVGVFAMFARTQISDALVQAFASVADQIALVIQRKRDEAALLANEERTRQVVGANPAVIYALRVGADMSLTPTWVSENMERLLGYSAQAASTFEWWAANVHPDDRDRVLGRMRTMVSGTDHGTHEYRMRHANGEYRWLSDEQRVLRDASGAPCEIVGSWSDVSDRKAAELRLEESEAQYRTVFDRNPRPSWIYDEETLRFLAVNDAATHAYGWSSGEFLEMTILDIRPPGEAQDTGIADGNDRGAAELRVLGRSTHLTKDGSRVEVEASRSPMRFHGRDAFLVFVTDVQSSGDVRLVPA